MDAELGATTAVFPSDEQACLFLNSEGHNADWAEIKADDGCSYDVHDEIDFAGLEPLIAKPSSPDNVVKVQVAAGLPIYPAYIGSSVNPGFRDFAIAAQMVRENQVAPAVSFDINPTSRQILDNLTREGHLANLIHAGARIHQAGCNGCTGMGQAPASGKHTLGTTPLKV